MIVSRSWTNAPGYGDLTLKGVELEEVESRRTLGVNLNSKLTFETYLGKVGSKALGVWVSYADQVSYFDCPRMIKSCFNAYTCLIKRLWTSSAEYHLDLLDSVFRYAKRLCEGELWDLGHGRKINVFFCFIRFITERIALCMSICIILYQVAAQELQLLLVI